jgi:putative N6-adenine methyltransferase
VASSDKRHMIGKGYEVSVVKKCLATGPRSLANLVPLAEGLYPSDLAALLQDEVLKGGILFYEGQYSLPTTAYPTVPGSGNHFELPEPHPLDYDWRFTADTAERLALSVLSETPGAGHIVLLGVPTVFDAIPRCRDDCRVTLFDGSEEFVRYVGAQVRRQGLVCKCIDVTVALGAVSGLADVVVCDPPWYVEYYSAFLAHASWMAKIGAPVFVSLLPLCSRPGCDDDRQEILQIAGRLGLVPYGLEPGALVYDTPLFERQSLARERLPVIERWRRGDLLVLRKVSAATDADIRCALQQTVRIRDEQQQWKEVLIGTRKVKLRNKAGADGCNSRPELLRIERDDVLPTVSRRYPGRRNVDLWLWDNRVFKVTNEDAFWEALRIAAGRACSQPSLSHSTVGIALEHVRRLLA